MTSTSRRSRGQATYILQPATALRCLSFGLHHGLSCLYASQLFLPLYLSTSVFALCLPICLWLHACLPLCVCSFPSSDDPLVSFFVVLFVSSAVLHLPSHPLPLLSRMRIGSVMHCFHFGRGWPSVFMAPLSGRFPLLPPACGWGCAAAVCVPLSITLAFCH